mmetsp:Transcript_26952/g.50326  ORF Transcript_26952/g.50326 Transcript_26952/m.50326 type:complete len:81 (-) Transcript_26952:188-430(-)
MTSEIHKLLSSSVRYSGSGDFSPDVLNFLVETVAAVVEDETAMNEDETLTMLLDAGLGDLDADELKDLAQQLYQYDFRNS